MNMGTAIPFLSGAMRLFCASGGVILAATVTGPAVHAGGLPSPNQYNTTPVPLDLVSLEAPLSGSWDVPLDPDNIEEYGQCTYWAAEKRPDLAYEVEYVYGYPQYHGAFDWKVDAVTAGYPVDQTPEVGDLAALPPGYAYTDSAGTTWTAGSGGHLAYVEQINSDGSFVVSEMNAGWPLHGDIALVPAMAAQGMYFIHQLHPTFFSGEDIPWPSGVYYLTFPNGNYLGYYSYHDQFQLPLSFRSRLRVRVRRRRWQQRRLSLRFHERRLPLHESGLSRFRTCTISGWQSVVYYYPDPSDARDTTTRMGSVISTCSIPGKIISK